MENVHKQNRHGKSTPVYLCRSVPESSTCMMSEWISWSPCSASCGMGMRSRERYVKQFPEDGSLCALPTDDSQKCVVNEDCCESTRTTYTHTHSHSHTKHPLKRRANGTTHRHTLPHKTNTSTCNTTHTHLRTLHTRTQPHTN